ncbi:MAG: hypothetical protein DIKNOCCD_01488 [bacterium]|nr:hypothetical protein [bacterium]
MLAITVIGRADQFGVVKQHGGLDGAVFFTDQQQRYDSIDHAQGRCRIPGELDSITEEPGKEGVHARIAAWVAGRIGAQPTSHIVMKNEIIIRKVDFGEIIRERVEDVVVLFSASRKVGNIAVKDKQACGSGKISLSQFGRPCGNIVGLFGHGISLCLCQESRGSLGIEKGRHIQLAYCLLGDRDAFGNSIHLG